MSSNNRLRMPTDEQIAQQLHISAEEYSEMKQRREQSQSAIHEIVSYIDTERVRQIKEEYQHLLADNPKLLAHLFNFLDLSTDTTIEQSTHVDEDGNERTVYTWTFTPKKHLSFEECTQ